MTDVYWTKKVAKESKEDFIGTSNTRYKVNTNDRSLTITDVDTNDAGTYRLNATNPVGTTTSEAIVLGNNINHSIYMKTTIKLLFVISILTN